MSKKAANAKSEVVCITPATSEKPSQEWSARPAERPDQKKQHTANATTIANEGAPMKGTAPSERCCKRVLQNGLYDAVVSAAKLFSRAMETRRLKSIYVSDAPVKHLNLPRPGAI
jgi:hypothetical protein